MMRAITKMYVCTVLYIFLSDAKQIDPLNLKPIVLVHGGAGNLADHKIAGSKRGVKIAARIGYETLIHSGSALDAVQAAVESMEGDPQFNAGYGAVLTWDGTVEMDAAIMNGADLNAGCVSVVRDIFHPIALARTVMQKTRHKYLAADGAMNFALDQHFEILPEGALITPDALKSLEDYRNSLNASSTSANSKDGVTFGSPGTVGAVAIDAYGNVAAATSTGGLTGKMSGRIGDSPILGGGTYADNAAGAISATGHGESIMRYNVASRILALIHFDGLSALDATTVVLEEMKQRFNETAGVISIDNSGEVGIYFTSKQMSWAYQRDNELYYGVEKDEKNVEIVGQPRFASNDDTSGSMSLN